MMMTLLLLFGFPVLQREADGGPMPPPPGDPCQNGFVLPMPLEVNFVSRARLSNIESAAVLGMVMASDPSETTEITLHIVSDDGGSVNFAFHHPEQHCIVATADTCTVEAKPGTFPNVPIVYNPGTSGPDHHIGWLHTSWLASDGTECSGSKAMLDGEIVQ